MKKVLAGVSALLTLGATGYFGVATASADDTPISGPPSPGLMSRCAFTLLGVASPRATSVGSVLLLCSDEVAPVANSVPE